MVYKYIKILFVISLFYCLLGCNSGVPANPKEVLPQQDSLLQEIKERGKLRAVIGYNVTGYFVYNGLTMGFQYEMLQAFAEHLNVQLELTVNDNLAVSFDELDSGKADLLAMNLVATPQRISKYNLSIPHSSSHQVLVQRNRQENKNYIDSIPQLAGKTVHVVKESSYEKQLQAISETLTPPVHIVSVDSLLSGDLIKMVAKGEIDFTIADNHNAIANNHYHKNIDVAMRISDDEEFTWAIRKNSDDLAKEVDNWLKQFKKTRHYSYINHRYFNSTKSMNIVNNKYFTLRSGKISRYDNLFKTKAKLINWDWRLLAALVYQESNFNNSAKSRAGAFGLMQLMPKTAKRYGVNHLSSGEENITGGIKFLRQVRKELLLTLEDTTDLLPLVLAAYNVGVGHLQDARRLARKYGANPDKWDDNVAYYLRNKSRIDFYNDPVVKYGYCRGEEPYLYVTEILERYKHYKNITDKHKE
ncbi:MAG: lytic transglycosylase F [Bacteroidia bacterium]|nr:MAG: lytic transglycosylase F [Bacteroidia bacterium]